MILKGKFFVEPFQIDPQWSGPHYGLDFGFSRDPNAAVELYICDATKTLYVAKEFWALHLDTDLLQPALEAAMPGISNHTVFWKAKDPLIVLRNAWVGSSILSCGTTTLRVLGP